MREVMLRKRVVGKVGKFVKTAQEEGLPVVPKIVDEGAPGVPPKAAPKAPPKTKMSPPPAPSKSKEEIESDVEEKIEKEKTQEGKIDKVEEKLTSLDEKFDTLIDAFSDVKTILEKGLLGKTDVEEKFDDLKEDESEDDKVSPEEFGMDSENLVVSTKEEEKMQSKAGKLRDARKARLSNKSAATLSEQFGLDKKEKKYSPESPVPTITKMKLSEVPAMLKLAELALDLNDAETEWAVVNKNTNEVHYVIAPTAENKEVFASDKFAEGIIADMQKMGIEAALTKYNAKKVTAQAVVQPVVAPVVPEVKVETKSEGEETAEAVESEEVTEPEVEKPVEMQASAEDYARRFVRAFRLALAAQQKNLIDNPLKAAWYEVLVGLDVKNPQRVIEAIFSMASADQFEVALQKTEEYLKLGDEAFVETASMIGDLEVKIVAEVEPELPVSKAIAMQERAKKASLALSTNSDSDPTDRMEMLQRALPTPKLSGISRISN